MIFTELLVLWAICFILIIVVGGVVGYTIKPSIMSIISIQLIVFIIITILLNLIFDFVCVV